MTTYLVDKTENACYGCRACEHICPQQAITMHSNHEGFSYPILDIEKCVNCGLCRKVCPYDNELDDKQPLQTYAAQYTNKDVLLKSSSGGIFSAVADYVLTNNGAVVGCAFNENIEAVHIIVRDAEGLNKLRGSKYVQSDTLDTYPQVKQLLDAGVLVLFTGTPCQVDGLKRYLRKDYDNLITLDLICHGVPSPQLFSRYLQSEKIKYGMVTDFKFRDKEKNGWSAQGSITYKEKTKRISSFNNSYYLFYLKNAISRMCCYSCKYSSVNRVGDITIGDYWNIDDVLPNVNASNGYSVILANTKKGIDIIQKIKANLTLYETDLSSAVAGNGNLKAPSEMPEIRKNIYSRIEKEGYEAVAKQECKYSYVKPFIQRHMPKWIKKVLKKILK